MRKDNAEEQLRSGDILHAIFPFNGKLERMYREEYFTARIKQLKTGEADERLDACRKFMGLIK